MRLARFSFLVPCAAIGTEPGTYDFVMLIANAIAAELTRRLRGQIKRSYADGVTQIIMFGVDTIVSVLQE